MKNERDCKIIQDLLPSYIEDLTKEETNNYIEEHLKECKNCSHILEIMKKDMTISRNNECKKETDYLKKYNKKLNIFKTLFITIIIVIVIIIARRMLILNDIQNRISKYENLDNYYIKTYYYSESQINIYEDYVKGEKYKKIEHLLSEEQNFYWTRYGNGNSENYYIETNEGNFAELNKEPIEVSKIINISKTDNLGQFIIMALTSNISIENCNGKECYKVELSRYVQDGKMEKYEVTEYIDKETGLTIRLIDNENVKLNDTTEAGNIHDYKYEFGNVTNEDFEEPDISEYEIRY